jgi:hypothetical protein
VFTYKFQFFGRRLHTLYFHAQCIQIYIKHIYWMYKYAHIPYI